MIINDRAGIAIAPILMAIALLGVIIAAFSMGSNSLGTSAITQDRSVAELRSNIDLIRSKIDECVMLTRQVTAPQFLYPGYNTLDTGILAKNLDCPRDPAGRQNLWTGARATALPTVTKGFSDWTYVNHGDPDFVSPGGICIKAQILAAYKDDKVLQSAIQIVLKGYSSAEYTFDPAIQQLIIWIKRPLSGTVC